MINKIKQLCLSDASQAATIAGWYQILSSIAVSLISIPIVITYLHPNLAGLWFAVQGVIAVFLLADFGFSLAITRQVSHSFTLNDDVEIMKSDLLKTNSGWLGVSNLYAASKIIFLRITFIATLISIITFELILKKNYIENMGLDFRYCWYFIAGSFIFVFYSRLSQSFLDGLGYMYITRIISGTNQLLSGVVSITSLLLGYGLFGLGLSLLLGSIIQFSAVHIALKRIASGRLNSKEPNLQPLVSGISKSAIPFGFVLTSAYLVGSSQFPLVGAILGPAKVTSLYLAFRVCEISNGFVSLLVAAQLPFFTQYCARGEWEVARICMTKTITLSVLLHLVVTLAIFFISPKLVELWLGKGHYISGSVLLLFAINYFIASITSVPVQFVVASGRNPFVISSIFQGLLTLLGILVLCPRIGILGVPFASLGALFLTNLWLGSLEGFKTWKAIKSFEDH